MTVFSRDSTYHRHRFLFFLPFKPENLPFIKSQEKLPNQQILATGVEKQHIGAVGALKETKTEIDAEVKFNFDYICPEENLIVNKEIFDNENSKKFNISLIGNLKNNMACWQKTLMASKSVLDIIETEYKIPFSETRGKAYHLRNNKSMLK